MLADATSRRVLLLGTLLLTVGLAGCAADAQPYDSYEDAKAASTPGPFSPNLDQSQLGSMSEDEANDVTLKVLVPETDENLDEGDQDVWILLYDEGEDEPITDADVEIEAWMPMMGHGTSGEEDPEHVAEGMYNGQTNWSMGGQWELRFDVTLGDNLLYFDPVFWIEEPAQE